MEFICKVKKLCTQLWCQIDTFCVWAVALYIITCLLDFTVWSYQYLAFSMTLKIFRYVCYLIFGVRILRNILLTGKVSGVMLGAGVLALLVVLFSRQLTIGFLVLILAACMDLDTKRLIRCTLRAVAVMLILVVLLSLIGVMPNWVYHRGETVRHSLGFIYPTDLFSVFLLIVMMYFYLHGAKVKYPVLVGLTLATGILYWVTDGRLSLLLTGAVLLVMLAARWLSQYAWAHRCKDWVLNSRMLRILAMCVPVGLLILCFVLVWMYRADVPLAHALNKLLSDRLLYNSNALNNYPITPFGSLIEWQGWGGYGYIDSVNEDFVYNYVDTSYMRILFDFGVIATLAALAGYTLLLRKSFAQRDWVLLVVLLIVLAWSFVEPYLMMLGRNVFVILLAELFNYGKIELNFLKKRKGKSHEEV